MTSIEQELQTADALRRDARFAAAAEAFRRAADIDRADARAWLGLSDALRESGRWDEALAAADCALRLSAVAPGRLADAHALRALALLGARRDGEASADAAAGAALADRAGEPARIAAARRTLALARLRAGRLPDAEAEAEAALRAAPDYPEGLATLALVRLLQGRDADADALFRQATASKDTLAEAYANHAALLARNGRGEEALRAALRAAALKPFLPEPHYLAGALLQAAGQLTQAAAAFAAALRADPGHRDARVNLADSLRRLDRAAEAAEVCRAGLAGRPDDFALLVNLGAALQTQGDADGALAAYEQAATAAAAQNGGRRPNLPEIDNNIAQLHRAAGRLDQAALHLRRAAAARPADGDIARSLAAVLLDAAATQETAQEAEAAARRAVAAAPADARAHALLGRVLARLDRPEEAEAAFAEAIRLSPPDDADIWTQAGVAFLRAGRRPRAAAFLRQAAARAPGASRLWALLGQALRGLRFTQPDDGLRADLLKALDQPGTEVAHLAEVAASAVLLSPEVRRLAEPTNSGDDDKATAAALAAGAFDALTGDALALRLLELAVIPSPELERAFTRLRRALLACRRDATALAAGWDAFACALALQCHLNEYVWMETAAETAALADVERRLTGDLAAGQTPETATLAVYAAYRPLHRLPGAATLPDLTAGAGPAAARLVARQAAEPLAEEALKAVMPRLTPVADAVSQMVRRQYEENPYPRWTTAGLQDQPAPTAAVIRAMFPHVALPPDPRWEAPEILIAGCGAGRESLWVANQFKGASVLAVDLSLSSLAYARRQSERLGAANIVYGQADILQLGALNRRFDIVQSVGVLHHMDDPMAGWRALTDLVRPGGLMKIGLYSERARAAVVAGRAFIAERGYGASTEEIRRFRQDALALPDDHPIRPATRSADFFSVSACRDLLFHVREHRMTPLQIADMLDRLGLVFLGFQLEDPATARLYRARFPDDPTMTSLAAWDRFEEERPLTFGGLYEFWLRRPG